MSIPTWHELARQQSGVLARRQLNRLGFDSDKVRAQLRAERWQALTPSVVCTSTGPLSREQRLWSAVLHCGGASLVGGLSAAAVHGLRGWERDAVTVLVDDECTVQAPAGVEVTRTRRRMQALRDPGRGLPVCRLEPAVLLWAGYQRSERTALGVLAASVQQRLTSTGRLREWIEQMEPLRRSRSFQQALLEIEGGAQSVAELDVGRMCRRFGLPRPERQVRRRDATGRVRFTDVEWRVAPGLVVVLEVDGAFHADVAHWEDDIARQRALTAPGRIVVRATAREVRDDPVSVARDLARLGVRGRVPHDAP